MKIRQIDVIPIRAPRKEVVRAGTGANPITHSEFGIIRVLTDEGIEGLGEISITSPRIGFSLCHAAKTLVAPALIGLDPMALPVVLAVIDTTLNGELSAPYIRAAFEMALLDLQGKALGAPVYQLLGGMARPAVPLAWAIYQKPPAEMAADAGAALAQGFKAIKLKVGRALADDLAAVRAVAEAVDGAVPIRLDANMAYRTIPEAVAAIDAFAGAASLAWVEQPLGRHNLDGLRLLRQRCSVPIMADESLQSLHDAYAVARAEAADVFNVYISEAGGILAAKQHLRLRGRARYPVHHREPGRARDRHGRGRAPGRRGLEPPLPLRDIRDAPLRARRRHRDAADRKRSAHAARWSGSRRRARPGGGEPVAGRCVIQGSTQFLCESPLTGLAIAFRPVTEFARTCEKFSSTSGGGRSWPLFGAYSFSAGDAHRRRAQGEGT